MPYYARRKVDYTPLPIRIAAEWLNLDKGDTLYELLRRAAYALVAVAGARGLYSNGRWLFRQATAISRLNI